jgi:hypothetical protein
VKSRGVEESALEKGMREVERLSGRGRDNEGVALFKQYAHGIRNAVDESTVAVGPNTVALGPNRARVAAVFSATIPPSNLLVAGADGGLELPSRAAHSQILLADSGTVVTAWRHHCERG